MVSWFRVKYSRLFIFISVFIEILEHITKNRDLRNGQPLFHFCAASLQGVAPIGWGIEQQTKFNDKRFNNPKIKKQISKRGGS